MSVKYALLIYLEEGGWEALSEDEQNAVYRQYADFGTWLGERGWARGGEELASTSSATSVRLENGRTVTTDGPYAETNGIVASMLTPSAESLESASLVGA